MLDKSYRRHHNYVAASSSTYEGSEPSESQTPVTSKKRKKPEYSNSEGANDMDNVRDEEENASARDSMQLRLPSASGRERISLLYNLGLEDSQIETQRWVEGMHRFNEHKHFRIKSPRPKIASDESQSEDADALDTVAFSQMAPPGWFGGLGEDNDVDVKLEDEPETADLERKNVRHASKSLHVGKIGILRKRNQTLQARLDIASQGLSDANAKNTQLAHLLCESRTHNREVTDELSRTADELAQANAHIQQMEEQLYSQNKIFTHVGTIFTSLSLSSGGSEADIFCDTLGAHLNNEYRETQ
ncbi:hypothetical protein EV359DRAFT_87647 [Lentinula novae-zelandiae]|nr:hypothetical protein EV359DRAFT_87647 [Lentinula novae-zelandiae]